MGFMSTWSLFNRAGAPPCRRPPPHASPPSASSPPAPALPPAIALSPLSRPLSYACTAAVICRSRARTATIRGQAARCHIYQHQPNRTRRVKQGNHSPPNPRDHDPQAQSQSSQSPRTRTPTPGAAAATATAFTCRRRETSRLFPSPGYLTRVVSRDRPVGCGSWLVTHTLPRRDCNTPEREWLRRRSEVPLRHASGWLPRYAARIPSPPLPCIPVFGVGVEWGAGEESGSAHWVGTRTGKCGQPNGLDGALWYSSLQMQYPFPRWQREIRWRLYFLDHRLSA